MKNKGSNDSNKRPKTGRKSDSLDTLALGGTKEISNPLNKRARNKDFTIPLSVSLASLKSDLEKAYRNSVYCSNTLSQTGKRITSSYCGNRWCSVCNRIRTMKLIKGYSAPIKALKDARFVTLTIPNVTSEYLREAILNMNHVFKNIVDLFKKRKKRGLQDWKFVGLKKIECTYNKRADTYHPHFHLIVEGEVAANSLIDEWLNRFKNASREAQHSTVITKGAEQELFKYVTKTLTKTDRGFGVYLASQDVIFRAFRGLQIFKSVSMTMEVSEEIEGIESQEMEGIEPENAVWNYELGVRDWVNVETGVLRTGYVRGDNLQSIIDNMI